MKISQFGIAVLLISMLMSVPTSSAQQGGGQGGGGGGGGGTSLPGPTGSGQCFISTAAGSGNWTWGSCSGSSSVAWSALGNSAANLSLSNAGYTTTFNQTSGVNWLWANTTAGTALTTNASPVINLAANYYNGSGSAADTWTLGLSLAAGTNGASTLTLAHTGSSGAATVVVPLLTATSVNGLTLTSESTGFQIAGGTTSETLVVPVSGTIGAAAFASLSGNTTTAATAASNLHGAVTGDALTADGSGNVQDSGVLLSSIGAWSALTNPTTNLALSMSTYNTTFNQTAASAWVWHNTTTATSGTTNQSPVLNLEANYWNGSASATDDWSISSNLAFGANGATTLNIAHGSGSSGAANVGVPGLLCGTLNTVSCVLKGYGSTSGTATLTWPTVAGTTTNPILFSNAIQVPAGSTIPDYLALAGGTMTGAIAFAAGQTWPTFDQSTTGNAGTATNISTNGTANQVWGMNGAGSAQGWQTVSGSGAVSSVSNSDGSLTISPTTGAVVASLNLANANTFTAVQTMPGATFSGTGAGYFALTQGADNCVANQPTGSVCWEAPASGVTSYHGLFAVTPSSGIPHYTYSSPTITETISAITPSDATGNTTGSGNFVLSTSPTFVTGLSSPAITDSGISQYGVLFAGSGGLLSGIPADFYYNDTGYDSLPTLQLGVRGSQPIDAHLEVYGSNDTSAHFHNVGTTGTGLSADGGIISLSAVPTGAALGSGVIMGTLQFGGSDSTSDTEATGAIISAWTTQAWSGSAFGSQLKFYTTPNSSTTLTQALLLDQNQAATFAGAVTISGQLLATEPTGSVWGSATGGAKGAGTINAAGLYVNGAAVGTSSGTVTSSGYSSGTPLAAFSTSTNITPATSSNVIALFGSGSCSGYLKSDGTCSTPGGSGTVTVVSSGSLTSTALVTGGGTTTLQTPSATSTLDSSGNLAVAAGGSLGSADSGSPKFTFASNKATFNQPLYLGTTSNQLVIGTSTNLTTLTFPASSGAVTLTFPITSEYMVGANSDTTTTHVLHATAVAGVFNSAAIGTGDLPTIPIAGGGTNATSAAAGTMPNATSTTAASWTATPTLGASGTLGSITMGNATSGTETIEPIAGVALSGTVYIPVPVNTPATLVQTVASGALALATSSISSGACQAVTAGSVNSASATNVATTDVIEWTPNGSIKAVTGYAPSTSGGLSIEAYPTAGYVNFDVCNWSGTAITPGAVTVNWKVRR